MRLAILSLILLITLSAKAQVSPQFTLSKQPVFIKENSTDTLRLATSGGFNAPIFNRIHLDQDTIEDLVVFDRSVAKLYTYLVKRVNGQYRFIYEPTYEIFFPKIKNWLLIRDYNGDGKKDLFASSNLGIVIYENTTAAGAYPGFRQRDGYTKTLGLSGSMTNLFVNPIDLPAIQDIDRDGDVDVVAMGSGILNLDFHFSKRTDLSLSGDSLAFTRNTQRYGRVKFNSISCFDFSFARQSAPKHLGATVLIVDADNDGADDILYGDISCKYTYFIKNRGTNQSPQFTTYDTVFPGSVPHDAIKKFVNYSYEDLDGDGKKDLIVSGNELGNDAFENNRAANVYLYKNNGSTQQPVLNFQKPSFMQDEMVDIGDQSYPALFDYDGDGDFDLLLGTTYNPKNNPDWAKLFLYENIGNVGNPVYKLVNKNYANSGGLNAFRKKPYIVDYDGDGKKDLVIVENHSGFNGRMTWIKNTHSGNGYTFSGNAQVLNNNGVNFVSYEDQMAFHDYDNDGNVDIFLCVISGYIEYYRNIGSPGSPNFRLANSRFLGINDTSYTHIYPSIAFRDFNNDGAMDMAFTSAEGRLKIYKSINQGSGRITPDTMLFVSPQLPLQWQHNFGYYSAIDAKDLNNDGWEDIVLGTGGGGVTFAFNASLSPTGNNNQSAPKSAKLLLELFPNPAQNVVQIQTEPGATLSIVDALGRLILTKSTDAERTSLDISALKSGVYYIKAALQNKAAQTKILIKD